MTTEQKLIADLSAALRELRDNTYPSHFDDPECLIEADAYLREREQNQETPAAIKVLIIVEGGIVQSLCASTTNVEYITLDYDSQSEEPVIIIGPCAPDNVFAPGKSADELFVGELSDAERFAQDHLRNINF